jgi:hypothetical protein
VLCNIAHWGKIAGGNMANEIQECFKVDQHTGALQAESA